MEIHCQLRSVQTQSLNGLNRLCKSALFGSYINSHFSFFAHCDIKFNPLAFFKGSKALHVNFGMMHKQIIASLIRSNKTKAFFLVEPFYCTTAHVTLLGSCRPANQTHSLQT